MNLSSKRITINFLFILFLLIAVNSCKQEMQPRYKDPNVDLEERVKDLLSRMTLEEKFWQLFMMPGDLSDGKEKYKYGIFGFQISTKAKSGNEGEQMLDYSAGGQASEVAHLINEIQKYFIEETRLGIPIIPFDEALHGLIREGATMFPQAIGLAATWDTSLMSDVAQAIAMETKTRGIRQILSPVLNITRDVRWGRTEETYGEDPFLTTQMALSFISSFEKLGIITTPKHFVANVGDGGRDSYPIHFNERLLEEIYFPAFKSSFIQANASSVMTSYNSLDGRPCNANEWLLRKKLKQEWGFNGFVISDADATRLENLLHRTARDFAESASQAIENGLDVIFQVSYDHWLLFWEAFEKGMINQEAIDEAVSRVLKAKFRLGLFENPYIDINEADKWNGCKEHRELARKAGLESIVLLKNENKVLPLDKNISSVAVIGVDAVEARLGGYSGPGNDPVSILQGIKNKIGDSSIINYAPGCDRKSEEFVTIPSENLFHYQDGIKKPGLVGKYYNNTTLEGEPVLIRIDSQLNFRWTLYSPDKEKINYDFYSARWTGKLVASESGTFEIGIKGDDGYKLFINNDLIIDNWKKQTVQQITEEFYFEKEKEYDIRVEFYETTGNVWFSLVWNMGVINKWKDEIINAVNKVKKSNLAIVTVGLEEGEFRDRALLSLPGHQEELINEIAATGKPVVVLLVGGSAVTMSGWMNNVEAILETWYSGDEGGNAIAEILFGDYNPAGRLPITFPIHEGQLPLYYNHKPTGRGDDYLNLSGKPLFPFGFGLSYTQFQYGDLIIEQPEVAADEKTTARFSITNTGAYDGDEVVQLYIKDLFASVARPVMELKGFQRVHLKKGETMQLSFEINTELLTMLDIDLQEVLEPGDFRIMIGPSSNDIRLRGTLKVRQ